MSPGVLLPEDAVMEDAPSSNESTSESLNQPSSPPALPVGDVPSDSSDKENRKVALDDMFNDDSDDDALMSSLAQAESSQVQAGISIQGASPTDPDVMLAFYAHLFPFRYLFQWLNHSPSPTNDFAHREFAFTLPNEAYLRYQSFPSADLLRKQCMQMTPSRFEIGPVYSSNPRDKKQLRNASKFRPVSKELVFDIDMTDYDPIRTCCSGASICRKCWTFITMAIKVVDVALKDDFGFKHVLWVYSGRRGAHAWVCDRRARDLDDSKRRAIATYMEVLKGGDKSGKRVNLKRPLHPHVERSLRTLRDHFQTDVLVNQDPWQSDDKANELLNLLPNKALNEALRKKWDAAPGRTSLNKWADIDALASAGASGTLDPKALRDAKIDILLEYTYPRLDAEVSKKLNHLLKSPFCVHPGTGRICVPIDTRLLEEFDPIAVPTVLELLEEIETWDEEHKGEKSESEKKVTGWEKTSLRPYVEYFRGFVASLLRDEKVVKREREDGDAMEF